MKKITPIIIFLILSSISYLQAQTIKYHYDDAGNCTERTIVLENKSASISDSTAVPSDVNDMVETPESDVSTPYVDILGEQEIKVFPNPTRGELRVTLKYVPTDGANRILVYSLNGSLILSKENLGVSNKINLQNQTPGTYLMRIILGNKTLEWKIIKK